MSTTTTTSVQCPKCYQWYWSGYVHYCLNQTAQQQQYGITYATSLTLEQIRQVVREELAALKPKRKKRK